jgi:hypothetical protein
VHETRVPRGATAQTPASVVTRRASRAAHPRPPRTCLSPRHGRGVITAAVVDAATTPSC